MGRFFGGCVGCLGWILEDGVGVCYRRGFWGRGFYSSRSFTGFGFSFGLLFSIGYIVDV